MYFIRIKLIILNTFENSDFSFLFYKYTLLILLIFVKLFIFLFIYLFFIMSTTHSIVFI